VQLLFLGRALLEPAQVSLNCTAFASLEISFLLRKLNDVSQQYCSLPVLTGNDLLVLSACGLVPSHLWQDKTSIGGSEWLCRRYMLFLILHTVLQQMSTFSSPNSKDKERDVKIEWKHKFMNVFIK